MARFPRLAVAVVAAASSTVVALTAMGAPAGAAGAATPLPERLTHIGESRQVVVVTTRSWTTSHARLQTWKLTSSGEWTRVVDPIPARVGWNGVRREANRKQNTGTTPAGTFGLLRGFGLAKPAGVDLPYRRVDRNDWWPYDPADPKTYNVFQPRRVKHAQWRTDWSERLKSYGAQYRYAVVLDYNLPSEITWRNGQRVARNTADTSAGGGIFLHVSGSGATAGCVSIARDQMRQVLRWLDPAKDPVIVIGPRDVIEKM
ncbi:MAG TPA: L,D-transpeptidase family protein [Actinomycetes bacterium]|jgi:L,D-peptidoglycan transpeptidase YkuD (ErfK/YbiS/YcfS/YnhG family)|nr:L,D-transpeptidase family protein [Actinomycetes bacterium]